MRTDKEFAQDIIDDPEIEEKFKIEERVKLDICEECPSKSNCWSCGFHKWW